MKKICHVLQTDYEKILFLLFHDAHTNIHAKKKAITQIIWVIEVNKEITHVLHTDNEKKNDVKCSLISIQT